MFDAEIATEAAPDEENDDYLLVSPTWAILLDGVSFLPGDQSGCIHGVRWFVSHLANYIASGLITPRLPTSLAEILYEAIEITERAHGKHCDTKHPMTPAATVAMVRIEDGLVDWLVLGDATVSWMRRDGKAEGQTDDRLERLKDVPIIEGPVRRYDQSYVARIRNTPEGFWVASSNPDAAHHAYVGSIPLTDVAQIGLYTDGITRLVERYGGTWAGLFEIADTAGPHALIEAVRVAEKADPTPARWRGKRHDDATAILLTVR